MFERQVPDGARWAGPPRLFMSPVVLRLSRSTFLARQIVLHRPTDRLIDRQHPHKPNYGVAKARKFMVPEKFIDFFPPPAISPILRILLLALSSQGRVPRPVDPHFSVPHREKNLAHPPGPMHAECECDTPLPLW